MQSTSRKVNLNIKLVGKLNLSNRKELGSMEEMDSLSMSKDLY